MWGKRGARGDGWLALRIMALFQRLYCLGKILTHLRSIGRVQVRMSCQHGDIIERRYKGEGSETPKRYMFICTLPFGTCSYTPFPLAGVIRHVFSMHFLHLYPPIPWFINVCMARELVSLRHLFCLPTLHEATNCCYSLQENLALLLLQE